MPLGRSYIHNSRKLSGLVYHPIKIAFEKATNVCENNASRQDLHA